MKILSAVINNCTFIEIQYHTLKKYFKGEYEFIVFNDCKSFGDSSNNYDTSLRSKIAQKCHDLGIQCIEVPNDHHKHITNYSERCSDVFNIIQKYMMTNPDKYFVIDSDMFLTAPFDILKYEGYQAAVVLQSRNNFTTNYIWNGLFYFDMALLKNAGMMDWGMVGNCDCGGKMEGWLRSVVNDIPTTDDIRWKEGEYHRDGVYFIRHLWSLTWNTQDVTSKSNVDGKIWVSDKLHKFLEEDPRNKDGKYFCEMYDGCFLHYRAGGGWRGEGKHLHDYLNEKLKVALI